jgi:hypothetical protein
MAEHDFVYHRIFGHPGMVSQLLRDFVAEPWLNDLDLDGMERLNAKFHSLRLLERRFGALPAEVRDRVAGADAAALETWGLRSVNAGSLEDVLR